MIDIDELRRKHRELEAEGAAEVNASGDELDIAVVGMMQRLTPHLIEVCLEQAASFNRNDDPRLFLEALSRGIATVLATAIRNAAIDKAHYPHLYTEVTNRIGTLAVEKLSGAPDGCIKEMTVQ